FAGDVFGLRNRGLDFEPEAMLDDAIELRAFFGDKRIGGLKRGELLVQYQQCGNAGGGFFRIELSDDFAGEFADVRTAGNARPGGVDAVKDVVGGGVAGEKFKGFGARAATAAKSKAIEALGFVHGTAVRREFGKGEAGNGIFAAD